MVKRDELDPIGDRGALCPEHAKEAKGNDRLG